MLAGIRDVTPRARLGTVMGVFGASTAVGLAAGPALAGVLIDGLGWSLPMVFWPSAALSIGTALLVTFGSREVRPSVVPQGRVLSLGVRGDPGSYGPGRPADLPHLRRVVPGQPDESAVPAGRRRGRSRDGPGLASAIALVMGTAALVGGLIAPLGGWLGDRVGFRHVLVGALGLGGVALALMPFAAAVGSLARLAVVMAAATATVSAMVFGLLSTEVPPERRSATLNLVYLPLYAAGIVGPALGARSSASAGSPDRSSSGRPSSSAGR